MLSTDLGVVVSLVVFVILTAFLLTFIILLFAWKRFRNLFFGTKKKKKQKQTQQIEQSEASAKQNKTPAERPARKKANSYYYGGVLTVPLDVNDFPAQTEQKKPTKHVNATFGKIPTVVIKTPKTRGVQNSNRTTASAKSATKTTVKTAAKVGTPAAKTKGKNKKQ